MLSKARVTAANVRVFTVPTDAPEADGTIAWDHTTMVLVELACGPTKGIGYSYADVPTGQMAAHLLKQNVKNRDVFEHGAILQSMLAHARNSGVAGVTAMAISAIDSALWDLRARLLDVPLADLLGKVRDGIPVYGSGGFTSYSDAQLRGQFEGWAGQGFTKFKMKVGSKPEDDPRRVRVARESIGASAALFVDANGAYSVKQALALAGKFTESHVTWFEEPVSSDNLDGLHQVRCGGPAGMDIAAGEYGYTAWYFDRMLQAGAVDVLQADATRCCGISGFLDAAALCWAKNVPLSSHCAPSLHLHVCCATPRAIHMEFFHDHARIERLFFDGFCEPKDGIMHPDPGRPGMGLTLKESEVAQFLVS